jgi:uncharacterized repeat protein (TIGR01451 family)
MRTVWVVGLLVAVGAMIAGGCSTCSTGTCPPGGATASSGGTCNICSNPPVCKIVIDKTGPKDVTVGQDYSYCIRVKQDSSHPAEGVQVTEMLPDNFMLTSTTPQATQNGKSLVWMLGHFNGGESKTITITGKATMSGPCTGCTTWICSPPPPPQVCLTTNASAPAIAVTLTGPTYAVLCDTLKFTARVTNTGTGKAHGVKVRDDLPTGMTSLGGQGALEGDVGELGPGESKDVLLTTRVAHNGMYTNVVAATADGGLTANSQTVGTEVKSPALVVTMTAPAERFIGRPVEYTITVRNTGDAAAKNTVLEQKIPHSVKLVSASNGGADVGTLIRWDLDTINPGEEKTVTLTITSTEKGDLRTEAMASAYCAEGSSNTSTAIRGVPGISFCTVGLQQAIEVGATETYRTTVSNEGSDSDANVALVFEIPAEQTYVGAKGPTEATVNGNTVTFAPISSLDPGKTVTFDVMTKAISEGDSHFKTTLSSDSLKMPVYKTESTHIIK